nr:competence protein CoiA family protein [Skermanella sp. TT6]
MRYALVDGQRADARPKLKGRCPDCDAEMVARCGPVNVWHWAHKGRLSCDPWWESETEWHRSWKNNFPLDWQEVRHIDQTTGERHIADVKIPYGLVIEFQNSPIDSIEMRSRENFYGKMIWIVNVTTGMIKGYFSVGLSGPIQKDPLIYQINWWSRSQFLRKWGEATATVYFDFGTDTLWRLIFYDPEKTVGAVSPIPKRCLIEDCSNGRAIRTMNDAGV